MDSRSGMLVAGVYAPSRDIHCPDLVAAKLPVGKLRSYSICDRRQEHCCTSRPQRPRLGASARLLLRLLFVLVDLPIFLVVGFGCVGELVVQLGQLADEDPPAFHLLVDRAEVDRLGVI